MTPILLTPSDQIRLERLLDALDTSDHADRHVVEALENEIAHARILAEEELPSGVVTIGADVTLTDMDTADTLTFRLVYPGDADLTAGKLSVLTPIGLAVLGTREGQEVQCPTPRGFRRLHVDDVERQ